MTTNFSEMLMRYLGSQENELGSPRYNCVTECKGEREDRSECVCVHRSCGGKGKKEKLEVIFVKKKRSHICEKMK